MADIVLAGSLDDASVEKFKEVAERLRQAAQQRRRKRTPKALRKSLEVGTDSEGRKRTVDIVDRAEYQRFLDDNFPGWSITDQRFWVDEIKSKEGAILPILFNCSLTIVVYENNIRRSVPGVGSAPVNKSEVMRDTMTLLRHKYSIAYTNAMKSACGWLGAFFDLRADEEERDALLAPPDESQKARFNELLQRVPEASRGAVQERWVLQNRHSATMFLTQMEQKIQDRENAVRNVSEAAHG